MTKARTCPHCGKPVTLQEAGRVGPLYYSCILAMNLALCAVILFFANHRW